MKGNISIKVEVPANVDRLIRELCKLDGDDVTEFYTHQLLDGLAGWLNTEELFNLKGLAKIHGLHVLKGLDPSTYGKEDQ